MDFFQIAGAFVAEPWLVSYSQQATTHWAFSCDHVIVFEFKSAKEKYGKQNFAYIMWFLSKYWS